LTPKLGIPKLGVNLIIASALKLLKDSVESKLLIKEQA